MYFIAIDGNELPVPVYYSVTADDVDSSDSGRSDETGVVHRNRIRHKVHSCDVKWKLPGSMLNSFNTDLSGDLLEVSLLDPATGNYIQCDMYAESIRYDFFQHQKQTESLSWWEISCRLTEY